MESWERFCSLNRRDRRVALEAAVVIIATRVGLRVAGYRRWKSLLSGLSPLQIRQPSNSAPELQNHSAVAPANLARLTAGVARRLFFKPTCLERSIGLWWLLRHRDFDAQIHIGGRKDGDHFEAHAWVECAGTVLSDTDDEYHRFTDFGDSRPLTARQLR
jgi:hypothetical protein